MFTNRWIEYQCNSNKNGKIFNNAIKEVGFQEKKINLGFFSLSIFERGGFHRYPLKLPLQITKLKSAFMLRYSMYEYTYTIQYAIT